nr:TetR/AcrR family transcriptional regulator [Mycobacterium eburneum]
MTKSVRVPAAAPGGIRRRPKDRKDQIARASAEAFSALGYHAVSMETIADKVGISAPALYRHYASKYHLFAGAVLALSQQLVDCTEFVDAEPDTEAAAVLDRVVQALLDVTLANRESGGLYRWQARYLDGDDQPTLMEQLRLVNQRIQRPLSALRPSLTSSQRWMLSSGLLSIIGSIVDHRVRSSPDDIRAVLTPAAAALLAAELPSPREVAPRPAAWRIFAAEAGVYEAVLHAAMLLFSDQGYPETSMAQIAAAAEIPVSGIYRYFSGKSEILVTGLRRAADRISGELSGVLATQRDPRQALTEVVDAYVATSFANPELASIYYTERVNLPAVDQALLRNVQRSTIDSWVQLLTAVRSDVTATQARFLVHAAMALVVDLGRLVHYDRLAADADAEGSAYPQACVRRLMDVTLFGAP